MCPFWFCCTSRQKSPSEIEYDSTRHVVPQRQECHPNKVLVASKPVLNSQASGFATFYSPRQSSLTTADQLHPSPAPTGRHTPATDASEEYSSSRSPDKPNPSKEAQLRISNVADTLMKAANVGMKKKYTSKGEEIQNS